MFFYLSAYLRGYKHINTSIKTHPVTLGQAVPTLRGSSPEYARSDKQVSRTVIARDRENPFAGTATCPAIRAGEEGMGTGVSRTAHAGSATGRGMTRPIAGVGCM